MISRQVGQVAQAVSGEREDWALCGEAPAERSATYHRVERILEWPMIALAIGFAALLVFETRAQMSPEQRRACEVAQWALWGVFVLEYVVLLVLAEDRGRFVRTHWLDLVVVVCPMLRVLRIARAARALRLLRVVRVGAAAGRAIAVVLMVTGISVFGVVSASIAAYFVEQSAQDESKRLDLIVQELAALRVELGSRHGMPDKPA